MSRTLHRFAWLLLLAIAFPPASSGAELPKSEEHQIEALIAAVSGMADAVFIRNGRSYDAATAAEFLRRKWRRHAAEVRSVEEFIDKVGSGSSTTGTPYRVRFSDGGEALCGDVLRRELAKLREQRP
jgi:hypothetical protein